MKTDIHPKTNVIIASCICGAEFELETTLPSLRVEICSSCHPFYAGTDKIIDTAGRIDKFQKKYNKGA
ncbi:MAG: 50S ribosomal protein L31 [Cyanobacteria bacterium]|nr:50S ribosomal protein L31 [Cyanobacteriota bacterium]MDA1020781.1 50S ribosomal protein L31 [Cyanobacteriota bacterium]